MSVTPQYQASVANRQLKVTHPPAQPAPDMLFQFRKPIS
jgi:hypothetical protein